MPRPPRTPPTPTPTPVPLPNPEGQRIITARINNSEWERLRVLSFVHRKSQTLLFKEALELLFQHYDQRR